MQSFKQKIVSAILSHYRQEIEKLTEAARAAHEAATHEESKAEDAHDTRGAEASYLAAGQSARIEELKRTLVSLQQLPLKVFTERDAISVGALVHIDSEGTESQIFLVPQGGGISVQVDSASVQIVSPQSPLGQALIGLKQGDVAEVESQKRVKECEVVAVG